MNKNLKFVSILSIFSILFALIVGEVFLRLTEKEFAPHPPYDTREIDDNIGWVIKENYSYKGEMSDSRGNNYPINVNFNEDGFRHFDLNSGNQNVFFIGDSYIQSVEVSDENTFYKILKDSLKFNLYAYGAAGYGNLQEYLVLEKYYNKVNPDVVVLQICTNDFIDNYYKLEENANYKVEKRRPYLNLKNEVEYVEVQPAYQSIKNYSHLLAFVLKKLNKSKKQEVSEALIANQKLEYKDFNYSVKATKLILKKFIKLTSGKSKLIVFTSDYYSPQNEIIQDICSKNNINYISGVGKKIINARNSGIVVHSFDGYHWNNEGHKIVSEMLLPHLENALSK